MAALNSLRHLKKDSIQSTKMENYKFWPYSSAKSVLLCTVILIGLPILFLLLHYWKGWPHENSLTVILIGIFILGVLPVLLALLDILVERGGKIEIKNFTIDFSKFTQCISPGITVPANIGIRGTAVYDSDTKKILDALKEAKKSNIVIIDIENGSAWWETRLLVLLSGAVRTGTPDKIVFVETIPGQEQSYIGWANPSELLEVLLPVNPNYKKTYYAAKAAAKQWELVEPPDPPPVQPIFIPFPPGPLAGSKQYLAFDALTGLPNDFLQEQFLQTQLGMKVETSEHLKGTLNITHGKLIDLFNKVLIKDQLEETWAKEEQLRIFFQNDAPYLVLTNNGRYLRMVPRVSILMEMFKSILLNKDGNTNNK